MGESIILCPKLLQQMDLLQCPSARGFVQPLVGLQEHNMSGKTACPLQGLGRGARGAPPLLQEHMRVICPPI